MTSPVPVLVLDPKARRASVLPTALDKDGKRDKAERGDDRAAREDIDECSPLHRRKFL